MDFDTGFSRGMAFGVVFPTVMGACLLPSNGFGNKLWIVELPITLLAFCMKLTRMSKKRRRIANMYMEIILTASN
jgi:hypothetical protein